MYGSEKVKINNFDGGLQSLTDCLVQSFTFKLLPNCLTS